MEFVTRRLNRVHGNFNDNMTTTIITIIIGVLALWLLLIINHNLHAVLRALTEQVLAERKTQEILACARGDLNGLKVRLGALHATLAKMQATVKFIGYTVGGKNGKRDINRVTTYRNGRATSSTDVQGRTPSNTESDGATD